MRLKAKECLYVGVFGNAQNGVQSYPRELPLSPGTHTDVKCREYEVLKMWIRRALACSGSRETLQIASAGVLGEMPNRLSGIH